MAEMGDSAVQLICDAMCDAAGESRRGGCVVVVDGLIEAVTDRPDASTPIRRVEGLLMPAMVNAHAHLDLTAMGPRSATGDFTSWGMQVIAFRDGQSGADIVASVVAGVEQSLAAGVAVIGDIAGTRDAASAMVQSGMRGVSYFECFNGEIASMHSAIGELSVHETRDWRVGVQPHAPYSADPDVYAAAVATGRPVSSHMAEHDEELRFVRDAEGPIVEAFKQWGEWDGPRQGTGKHPVDWLAEPLRAAPWLLAHCNYVDDEHIASLAGGGATVAYCPVASEYFGHRGHRYRDMLDAGVNVCLGTDSILCQPSDEPQPMSVLAQMRHLYQRDQTEPRTLLAMATVNGAKGLRMEPNHVTLIPGAPARFAVVPFDVGSEADPLTQVLTNRYPVSLLDLTGGRSDVE